MIAYENLTARFGEQEILVRRLQESEEELRKQVERLKIESGRKMNDEIENTTKN